MFGKEYKVFGEKVLGVEFQSVRLLIIAFTHRSFLNENKNDDIDEHNERLEFLGDAVFGIGRN